MSEQLELQLEKTTPDNSIYERFILVRVENTAYPESEEQCLTVDRCYKCKEWFHHYPVKTDGWAYLKPHERRKRFPKASYCLDCLQKMGVELDGQHVKANKQEEIDLMKERKRNLKWLNERN